MSKRIGVEFPTFNSFIVSLGLYFFIVILLFYKVANIELPVKYTNNQDAFMDVLLTTQDMSNLATEVKSQEDEPIKRELDRNVDLNELFSSVDTKKIKNEIPEESQKKISQAKEILDALKSDLKESSPASGTTGEFNEYFGKINQIIESRWRRLKVGSNNQAKVRIIIDKYGKFSYNIVSLSYNSEFNDKVRDFLPTLQDADFPKPPDGKEKEIICILTDEILKE